MNPKSGIDIRSSRLKGLRPTLKRWICLNGDLAKRWAKIRDVPWWYRERALLGILAGAVWLSKGVALEEYSDEKRRLSGRGRILPRSYAGRVDLYFEISAASFAAEAKHVWLPSSKHKDQKAKLESCLNHACRDIRKLRAVGTQRLAIVFVSPYVTAKSVGDLERHVEWALEEVQSIRADAVAWIFPELGEYGKARDGSICPGIAMLIKEVRR
jgi:hypothetical protein